METIPQLCKCQDFFKVWWKAKRQEGALIPNNNIYPVISRFYNLCLWKYLSIEVSKNYVWKGNLKTCNLIFLFYFWLENFKSRVQQIAAVGIAEPTYNQIEFFSVKKKTLWIWKEALCSLPAHSYFSIMSHTPVVPAIVFFRSITSVNDRHFEEYISILNYFRTSDFPHFCFPILLYKSYL